MKTFNNYCKLRESSATNIGKETIGNSSLSNQEETQLSALYQLIDYAWQNYESQIKSAFQSLRHDPEISNLLDRIESEGIGSLRRATRKTDKESGFEDTEEIVPSSADTSPGLDQQE